MMATVHPTAARIAEVRARIAHAEAAAGRAPDSVRLIAVTKTHGSEACEEAAEAGVTDLGENRVQELSTKAAALAATRPEVRWHLIGPLQSNKVAKVVNRGWWLHGLDREAIVDRVASLSEFPGQQVVLVQVNVGADPAKAGCTVAQAPALVARAAGAGLAVRGLMTIPPLAPAGTDANSAARRHFSALRELRERLRGDHPQLTELSMGMTADLEAAVAEGATMVRVGTAIFGTRGTAP